jgi:chemotaxis protein methyltransferase CheR
MTKTEFETFSGLIYQRSGINMGSLKLELLRARVGKRLRALKLPSVKDYYQALQTDASGLEMERLIDVVTTNKTEFFREAQHYEHLVRTVLPPYKTAARPQRPLRFWSAACSSGEEPYSLAMVLFEALGPQVPFKILATDISSRMLHRGMEAWYSAERMQGVSALLREKYFQREDREGEKGYRASAQMRETVQFSRFNLNDPAQYVFENGFDAILCRNVMIYFDRPTQEAVVGRLSRHLLPGAFLYTGFSESLIGIRHPLKPVGASVYQMRGAGGLSK